MSDERRYERYAAWCQILGVRPAPFNVWRGESAKIPELHILALTRQTA